MQFFLCTTRVACSSQVSLTFAHGTEEDHPLVLFFRQQNVGAGLTVLTSLPNFAFQKAVEVMCFVPKRCNDMMNVGRLQGFEVGFESPQGGAEIPLVTWEPKSYRS